MTGLVFQIDWGNGFVVVPPPMNWKDCRFEGNFVSAQPSATLQSINFEWAGDNAIKINKYKTDGLTGGRGICEGLPLLIDYNGLNVFTGIIALNDPATLYECDIVKAPIVMAGHIDWLNNTAQSFDFALLASLQPGQPGYISQTDYKKIPYIITSFPDFPQLVTLTVTDLVMVQQIYKEIYTLTQMVAEIIGDTTADAGEAFASAGTSFAQLAGKIVSALAELIYIGVLFASIISTTTQILDQIIQVKKYKLCMCVDDCFKKASEYLGIQYTSSIFAVGSPFENATIMPKKIVIPKTNQFALSLFERPADENGNPKSFGYPEGTFRKLLDDLGITFNAKPVFYNGILTFEEVHFYNEQSGFIMPNQGAVGYQYNYPSPYGVNSSELASSYELKFTLDSTDDNTVRQYAGTTCEVIIQPNVVGNSTNLLLPGLTQVNIPFALAKRKEYLSIVEQSVNFIFNGIDTLINVLLQGVNALLSLIPGQSPQIPYLPTFITQIGRLELSNDTFNEPKIFIGIDNNGDWEISPNNASVMSADNLMQNFHGKNLMSRGNQAELYTNKTFAMNSTEFVNLFNNNVFTTPDGKVGKFDKLIWNPYNQTAEACNYRVYNNWTNNFKETIIIDGTQ